MQADDLEQYESFLKTARELLAREGRAAEIPRVEERVHEAISQDVPFAAFSSDRTVALPIPGSPTVPELVSSVEISTQGLGTLDQVLADVAEAIGTHAKSTGWLSRRRLERTRLALEQLDAHVTTAGSLTRNVRELLEARSELDRFLAHQRIADRVREKEVAQVLLRIEAETEELRARIAEARQRRAIAEDTARQFAGTSRRRKELPSMTVRDLQKKSGDA